MLKNALKVAFRTMRRQPGYALIHVFGLGVGMASFVLIAMFVRTELSYESHIPHADKIYRFGLDVRIQGQEIRTAYTARPLGPTLVTDFPEVESATRLWFDPSGNTVLRYGDNTFPESRVFYADPSFFEVFDLPFVAGNPSTALDAPFTIVLTASMAAKYFGDQDPMGQTIHLREPSDNDIFDYTVTGVMEDLPATSHLDFDFLASYVTQRQSQNTSWLGFGVYTYAKIAEDADPTALESKLSALFETYGGPQVLENYGITYAAFQANGNAYRYFMQLVSDIHLHSDLEDEIKPASQASLVYLFGLIGVFILLLAAINFINLATARGSRRGMEVGVRKTLGSDRIQLVGHFLTEALLLSGLASALAFLLIRIAVPFFNQLMGHEAYLITGGALVWMGILIGLMLIVGIGAGLYPALYLSSFHPAKVLKGSRRAGRRNRLRDVLVVFQFGVATALIACTVIVYGQMQYINNRPLGFDAEQVVVLEGAEVLRRQGEAFRETVRRIPGVSSVTNSELVPGRLFNGSSFKMQGANDDSSVLLEYTYASFDFVETLGLELVEGRSLSRAYSSDSLAVLLNESAVKALGITNPIGKQLEWTDESVYTIVGVVRDFHFFSLHQEIGPLALLGPDPRNQNRPNLLVSVRLETQEARAALAAIGQTWQAFAPDAPFVYSFLNSNFEAFYRAEQRTGTLISLFAALAVLIACIGLLGLTSYLIERRRKEIGLRKVLGASITGIVGLLSKDFAWLVGIGIAIASPLAYLAMNRWVENFAYAIEIGPAIFVGAGLLVLLLALLTVSYQAIRAARSNPVDALGS